MDDDTSVWGFWEIGLHDWTGYRKASPCVVIGCAISAIRLHGRWEDRDGVHENPQERSTWGHPGEHAMCTRTHPHPHPHPHTFDSLNSWCLNHLADLIPLQKLKSEIDNVMADILSFESSEERYVSILYHIFYHIFCYQAQLIGGKRTHNGLVFRIPIQPNKESNFLSISLPVNYYWLKVAHTWHTRILADVINVGLPWWNYNMKL